MANGQTIIKYGEIRLYRCVHTMEQKPVYDSGRNVVRWQFIVRGVGYLHGFNYACKYAEVVTTPSPTATPTKASQAIQQIRWRLTSRQAFVLAVGCASADVTSGTNLLVANPMTSITSPRDQLSSTGLTGYDVDDGPRVLQFDTIHVSGDNIYKIAFTFEVNLVLCTDTSTANNNKNGVLSNRWSVSDAWDHNKRTIRTYQGQLELASSNFSPHWFRSLVVPPLQYGMRRDYGQFVATEDGKHLQYTITDTEVAIAAPAPATRWAIQHTETTLSQDGLKVTSQCVVELEGQSDCDVGQLIVLGIYAVSAKIAGVKPGEATVGVLFMNDISISVATGDVNAVRVSASAWRPAQQNNGLLARAEGWNKEIKAADLPAFAALYNNLESDGARPGQTTEVQGPIALAGIFRCYLQSSCSSITGIADEALSEDQNDTADNNPKQSTSIRIVPSVPVTPVPYYSASQNANTYALHQMESQYRTKSMRVAMPIARTAWVGSSADVRQTVTTPRLTNSICYRIVRISADRIGAWPELPNAETMDGISTSPGSGYATPYGSSYPPIPQKLLHTTLLARNEIVSANGVSLYHAEWEAVYVLLRAPTETELRKIGQSKWKTGTGTLSNSTLTNSSYPM